MSQPTITYRVLHTADEIAPMRDLEARIWHSGLDTTVPGHMMKVVADCGGHVQAAYDGDRMIGFSMGMLSRVHGQWVLWSHMAGVDPDYQAQGIGRQLKLNQRVWALENGFERISWTFNPLLRQNANFNLFVLGGRASTYKINTYGELNDGLNASLPTDRLVADWDLRDDRVRQHAENGPSPLAIEGDVPFVVEQGENDEPIIHQPDWASPTLAIGIPYDLSRLLREKPKMGREWYEAARASFIPAFESGYVAVDFVRQEGRCWYVLQQMRD